MKRSNSGDASGSPNKEDAEMDVDDEEKAELEDLAEEDDEVLASGEEGEKFEASQNPFLDSFYGISSPDASDRAQAGRVMLHHCLTGPDANSKDASYALKRLMNGLCSGRAAARQGNASALASFLKIAFALGKMEAIKNESKENEEKNLTNLAFVRQRLRASTEPGESHGKRKRAEERDIWFGRLFGINAVVRSGILLPMGEDAGEELDSIIQTTSGFVKDLADLYGYKKWIREPAAHAVETLLNAFYSLCPDNADAQKVVECIVEDVVIPRLLSKGVLDDNGPLFTTYTAEQIAIAVNIQTHVHLHLKELPFPINSPVFTTETIPIIASALSGTSAVSQPRTHLVWDNIWSFITVTDDTIRVANVDCRKVRHSCPLSGESVDDLLEALLKHVVIKRLFRLDETTQEPEKATDDRRALALCLIRNLSGVEFMSSLTARTKLILEPEMLERQVFRPLFVRTLFLNVICKSGRSPHVLKPLALYILDASSQALSEMNDTIPTEQRMAKRLALVKALLRCEPHFDTRTKTSTVDTLLALNIENLGKNISVALWENYIAFLEQQIVAAEPAVENNNAKVYVDVLFHFGKKLLKMELEDRADVVEFKLRATRRIFVLLMTVAFFDCQYVRVDTASALKQRKSKEGPYKSMTSTVVRIAALVKEARADTTSTFPFEMRSLASARFFSFVADSVTLASHSSDTNRAFRILELLSGLDEMRRELLKTGATQLTIANAGDQMDTEEESPESITVKLCKDAHEASDESRHDKTSVARMRWVSGCAVLASALHLHLLSPVGAVGDPDDDDPNADADEDYDEIVSNIEDVHHVAVLYSSVTASDGKPLDALAELCTNILSSPLGTGNQSRGGSPTLLREVVKFAWTGGLYFFAVQSKETTLSSHVINVLLNAIGAIDGRTLEEEIEESDGDISGSEDESSGGDSNDGIFSKAVDVLDVRDEEMDKKGPKKAFIGEENEIDLELDPRRLQSMLEESDAEIDEGELEHHEGADAALAKLIQLKQDARKAGQLVRERTEIARQLRCIPLLETVFVGRAETWGSLLRMDIVLQIIFSILRYRREIVNSLEKAAENGSNTTTSEKRALVGRLTSLIKAKALKAKLPDSKWSKSISVTEFTSDFAAKLFREGKSSTDKDQQMLCNSAMVMMLRAIPGAEMKLQKAELYADAVNEWATKRTNHLETACFEDLIHHYPVLAQGCLVPALASAASTARSSFLKSESFRLLSLLYNPKLNPNISELDKLALERIVNAGNLVFESVLSCLKDVDMKKAKRLREVIKTAEKVVAFLAAAPVLFSLDKECLDEIIDILKKLKGDSESDRIQQSVETLVKDIGELLLKKCSRNKAVAGDEDGHSNNPDARLQPKKSRLSKKKKKQNSKKKKR